MFKHGTTHGYRKYKCRCEDCTAAHAVQMQKYRQSNPDHVRRYERVRSRAYRELVSLHIAEFTGIFDRLMEEDLANSESIPRNPSQTS